MRRGNIRSFGRDDAEAPQWTLHVKGKGDFVRGLHLPLFVINELRHYFRQRGHASLDDMPTNAPLIARLDPKDDASTADVPLSAARLYDIIKSFFAGAANALPECKHEAAQRIHRASTHWLRHTFATHLL